MRFKDRYHLIRGIDLFTVKDPTLSYPTVVIKTNDLYTGASAVLHQPGQHAHSIPQQRRVGERMDVALKHRYSRYEPCASFHFLLFTATRCLAVDVLKLNTNGKFFTIIGHIFHGSALCQRWRLVDGYCR